MMIFPDVWFRRPEEENNMPNKSPEDIVRRTLEDHKESICSWSSQSLVIEEPENNKSYPEKTFVLSRENRSQSSSRLTVSIELLPDDHKYLMHYRGSFGYDDSTEKTKTGFNMEVSISIGNGCSSKFLEKTHFEERLRAITKAFPEAVESLYR